MESSKIEFIKKFREQLDVSMQITIEYYNKYDADLEKSVAMLKNDFITKLQKELDIDFEEVKEALESYKYNYESAYLLLKGKNMQLIDKILMNEKLSNQDKIINISSVYGSYRSFDDYYPIKSFKEALMFFCEECGYNIGIDNNDYKRFLEAALHLDDKSILDILNTLQDENGKFVPEKYRKHIPELQEAILKIVEENKTLFYE